MSVATWTGTVTLANGKRHTKDGFKTAEAVVAWMNTLQGVEHVGPKARKRLLANGKMRRKDGTVHRVTQGGATLASVQATADRADALAADIKATRASAKATKGKVCANPKCTEPRDRSSRWCAACKAKTDASRKATPLDRETDRKRREWLTGAVARAKQQQDGVARQLTGQPHGMVTARAGTGKTTTQMGALAYTHTPANLHKQVDKGFGFAMQPSPAQQAVFDFVGAERATCVRYIAFNKSIVNDFSRKYKWLVKLLATFGVSLEFSTIHSMGYRVVAKAYKLGRRDVSKFKTRDLLAEVWGGDGADIRSYYKDRMERINATEALVDKCKITLAGYDDATGWQEPSNNQMQQLANHYDIQVAETGVEFEEVRELLRRARTNPKRMDYADMIWLPVVNGLKVPCVDLLMVDEAQDLNRCQQVLSMGAGSRLLLVGDDRQAIYGFAGADVGGMQRVADSLGESKRGLVQMQLTQTYRCSVAVTKRAQRLVDDLEHLPNAPEGSEETWPADKAYEQYGDKDLLLCRTNAPLVGLAFKLLRDKRKANIQGRDLGTGLKNLIKDSKATTVDQLLDWVDNYERAEMERLRKRRQPPEEVMQALVDKCSCLRAVCDGAVELSDATANIDRVFQGLQCPKCRKSYDEDKEVCWECKRDLVKPDGVLLSSIHKAKGMEADRVFVLHPEQLPHPMAKSKWAREQEANLEYVAYTRAITTIITVEGAVQ